MRKILIIGASGAIGKALYDRYKALGDKITAITRTPIRDDNNLVTNIIYDFNSPDLNQFNINETFDIVIFATGHLHNENFNPEKAIKDIDEMALAYSYYINCIAPLVLIRKLVGVFNENTKLTFLSARVSSISDNNLGGWYGYRMSKAALNMMIKNLHLEFRRTRKSMIVCGLHPGTVRSKLSENFLKSVKHEIFTPYQAANYLADVIDNLSEIDSGRVFDYKKEEIFP